MEDDDVVEIFLAELDRESPETGFPSFEELFPTSPADKDSTPIIPPAPIPIVGISSAPVMALLTGDGTLSITAANAPASCSASASSSSDHAFTAVRPCALNPPPTMPTKLLFFNHSEHQQQAHQRKQHHEHHQQLALKPEHRPRAAGSQSIPSTPIKQHRNLFAACTQSDHFPGISPAAQNRHIRHPQALQNKRKRGRPCKTEGTRIKSQKIERRPSETEEDFRRRRNRTHAAISRARTNEKIEMCEEKAEALEKEIVDTKKTLAKTLNLTKRFMHAIVKQYGARAGTIVNTAMSMMNSSLASLQTPKPPPTTRYLGAVGAVTSGRRPDVGGCQGEDGIERYLYDSEVPWVDPGQDSRQPAPMGLDDPVWSR
jgi:hypothetical protein